MREILRIQTYIFLALILLSFIITGTPWLPIMVLFGTVAGPFIAYDYPWNNQTHLFITFGFLSAVIMMGMGIKYNTMTKGIILFLLGFWLWTFIGLVFGLGTGT